LYAAAVLASTALGAAAFAQSTAANAAAVCSIHVYPADALHSVGEDFDAVHAVDQDLHHYYETAGRPLDWLTPTRQLALLDELPVDQLVGIPSSTKTLHSTPLSRHQALQPGPREAGAGCMVEMAFPQIMLERGGLATRSLRLFGVVRRYEDGVLVGSFSGFAAAPMTNFQLKSPADAELATAIVENAYRGAVETLLRNSAKSPRK
jgi:hypothetical protein